MSTELTHEDVQRILKIIDEAKHLEELDLVYGNFRLHIRRRGSGDQQIRSSAASPTPAAPADPPPAVASVATARPVSQTVPAGMVAVRAPMLGTFYRSPSPGEKPFVEVDQQVKADDTVCIIEVMKLFNSIKAGVDGKVVEIRAENAALVEYHEVLILIEPAKA